MKRLLLLVAMLFGWIVAGSALAGIPGTFTARGESPGYHDAGAWTIVLLVAIALTAMWTGIWAWRASQGRRRARAAALPALITILLVAALVVALSRN